MSVSDVLVATFLKDLYHYVALCVYFFNTKNVPTLSKMSLTTSIQIQLIFKNSGPTLQ
jgi:hypothetical protein